MPSRRGATEARSNASIPAEPGIRGVGDGSHAIIATVRGLPAAFWWLWAGSLVNRLGGFVYAFLALYLTSRRGFSPERAGLVVALYGFGQTLAAPVGGALADRIGRRATILVASVGGAAGMLQLGLSARPAYIGASAAVLGFVGDLYRPAVQASVADLVPPEDRVRAYGYLYWAANLGWAFAAVVAGFVASWGYLGLFIGDAATTLLFGVIVFLRVPESLPCADQDAASAQASDRSEGSHRARSTFLSTFLAPFRDARLTTFVGIQFLVILVFMQAPVAFSLDLQAHGVSARAFGLLVALNGVLIVLFQPMVVRLIASARAPSRALALGAVLTGLGFGLNGLATEGWLTATYVVSVVTWTAGEILFSTVVPTVVAELSPPALRGGYQGMNNLSWGLAACTAPILGGWALGHVGSQMLWAACAVMGGVAGGLHLVRGHVRVGHGSR